MTYELAALGAALCWTFAALLAGDLSKQLGGITFNRLRNVGVFFVLLIIVTLAGWWGTFRVADLGIILASGLVGVAIGDSFLFSTMQRLGPRRAHILYACNAPITVIFGIIFLGEQLNVTEIVGIILVFAGVVAAIRWGRPKTLDKSLHAWEKTQGTLMIGVLLGIGAALGQACGALLIKPVLDSGAHPMMVSTLRVGVSALFLTTMLAVRSWEPRQSISGKQRILAGFNGVLAIGIGMSLLLYAFSIGDVGIASILSTTQAVMMLPIIWMKTHQRPAFGAWLGAILVILGVAIMLG